MPQPRVVHYPRRLVIKLRDGSTANGAPPAAFSAFVSQLQLQYPELSGLQALFDSARWGQIHDAQKGAVEADLAYQPVDFTSYWRILVGASVPVGAVLRALRLQREVVHAYLDPAGTGTADPDFGLLAHFKPAPQGIALEAAWGVGAGARGQGVVIADLERGWDVAHPEFGGLLAYNALTGSPEVAHGVPQLVEEDREHGCNVLGILMAQEDGAGLQGAADQVGQMKLYSYLGADGHENIADAAMSAVLSLSFGDVLLLEVQATEDAPYPAFMNRPVEIAPAVFAAVRLAAALGIVVVEPAGNDSADLDVPVSGAGPWTVFDREASAFKDSGALLVAASQRFYGGSLKRLPSSNHGNRVDLFAVGETVSTTSLHPPGYALIDGTTPAAAVIAGAAAVVQSAPHGFGAPRYSSAQLRWLLSASAFSTPSHNPASDGIGRMTDLGAIFAGAALPKIPDVYLRDYLGDVGDAHAGALSSSPDVILRQSKSADPEAEFGAASGALDAYDIHQDAVAGATHWIYARVHERGGADAADVGVRVWWSPPATLIRPADWTLIGDTHVPLVPAGGVAVSEPLEWSAAPAAGHYCFLAIASHGADPAPVIPDFADISAAGYDAWTAFKAFLRRTNNATWRNFNVLPAAAAASASTTGEQEFFMRGAPDRIRRMRLALRFAAGAAAAVRIRVPDSLWEAVAAAERPAGKKHARGGYEFQVASGVEVAFSAMLAADVVHAIGLSWTLTGAAAREAQFEAIQSEVLDAAVGGGEDELGRVSWIWKEPSVRKAPAGSSSLPKDTPWL